jgi:hypothetical protein
MAKGTGILAKKHNMDIRWLAAGVFVLILAVAGCAGTAPVPGGSDTENLSFYKSKEDLLARLDTLAPGTPESIVFQRLDRKPSDFTILKRDEIMTALLGSSNVEVHDAVRGQELAKTVLQSLYGYRLNYTNIEREHGFTSPIRIRTDENGYSYIVTLIFRDGRLYERPIVTGGVVNKNSSKTIFDYINPSTFLSRVP